MNNTPTDHAKYPKYKENKDLIVFYPNLSSEKNNYFQYTIYQKAWVCSSCLKIYRLNKFQLWIQVMMICCCDQNVEAKTNKVKMQISGTKMETRRKRSSSHICPKSDIKESVLVCWWKGIVNHIKGKEEQGNKNHSFNVKSREDQNEHDVTGWA